MIGINSITHLRFDKSTFPGVLNACRTDFRDVVFEDVVFDNSSSGTPY